MLTRFEHVTHLLQDLNRELSVALSKDPNARRGCVRMQVELTDCGRFLPTVPAGSRCNWRTDMTSRWIGPDENLSVGDVGFLIAKTRTLHGSTHYEMRYTPAHTNRSHEPRLNGWCGTYNDLSTSAEGLVRVERTAKNGRAFVRELEGEELEKALDELGYPELLA